MDKMQEDFEAWHKSVVEGKPRHEKYNSGDYRNQHVQRYWLGWKARHESLVIELPEAWRSAGSTHELMHKRDTVSAIEAAGLKVKP